MTQHPHTHLSHTDPFDGDTREQLRHELAAARVLDVVEETLGVLPDGPVPDVSTNWLEFQERISVLRKGESFGDGRAWRSSGISKLALGKGGRWGRGWFAAAALGVLLAVASWRLGRYDLGHRAVASVMTYTTGNGERATITLPDGGTVTLNVASRLEVPLDYMTGSRIVRLVGEGFFTVPHHDGAPLTVIAGGTTARVLGTSFVVRRYTTDTSAIVAVRDGKVAVGTTVVTANQLAEVGRRGVPRVRLVNGDPFTFATGTLTIDGLPLPAAIVELNRWYDTDIRLGDSALASEHMKGKFGAGSLSDLAEILEATYDVRVVRDGRVLTLYPKQ